MNGAGGEEEGKATLWTIVPTVLGFEPTVGSTPIQALKALRSTWLLL